MGTTLSAVMRDAWDGGKALQVMAKHSGEVATGAHVSVVAHITKNELLRRLDDTEAGNGFGNRFLWVYVRRSKYLPLGGQVPAEALENLARRVQAAVAFARELGRIELDREAIPIWEMVYPELSEGKPGLLGAMIARAEAQVLRVACIYAVLDCSRTIKEAHLKAALAVWQYAEDSARFVFGDALGDPVADQILETLKQQPEGMTRTEIRDLGQRHWSAGRISSALHLLTEMGLARSEVEPTEGRPAEWWYATATKAM